MTHVANKFGPESGRFDGGVAGNFHEAFGLPALGDVLGDGEKKSRLAPIVWNGDVLRS